MPGVYAKEHFTLLHLSLSLRLQALAIVLDTVRCSNHEGLQQSKSILLNRLVTKQREDRFGQSVLDCPNNSLLLVHSSAFAPSVLCMYANAITVTVLPHSTLTLYRRGIHFVSSMHGLGSDSDNAACLCSFLVSITWQPCCLLSSLCILYCSHQNGSPVTQHALYT